MINQNFPIISIVTPSYNQGIFISDTIESVILQKGDFYLDYIIMDGASKDNSIDVIQKFAKDIEACQVVWENAGLIFKSYGNCKGVSYRWISEKDNGQSDAINKGINLISKDSTYFNWLCSDDSYCTLNSLEYLIKESIQINTVIYGKSMYRNQKKENIKLYNSVEVNKENIYYEYGIPQPSALIYFNDIESIKINEKYQSIMDLELWIRLMNKGFLFKYVEKYTISFYTIHENSKTVSWRKKTYEELLDLNHYYSKVISKDIARALFNECIYNGSGIFGNFLRLLNLKTFDNLFFEFTFLIYKNIYKEVYKYIISSPLSGWTPYEKVPDSNLN
jgi:GT2 family glycosyltransferase